MAPPCSIGYWPVLQLPQAAYDSNTSPRVRALPDKVESSRTQFQSCRLITTSSYHDGGMRTPALCRHERTKLEKEVKRYLNSVSHYPYAPRQKCHDDLLVPDWHPLPIGTRDSLHILCWISQPAPKIRSARRSSKYRLQLRGLDHGTCATARGAYRSGADQIGRRRTASCFNLCGNESSRRLSGTVRKAWNLRPSFPRTAGID